jgi:hypothetical protein
MMKPWQSEAKLIDEAEFWKQVVGDVKKDPLTNPRAQ